MMGSLACAVRRPALACRSTEVSSRPSSVRSIARGRSYTVTNRGSAGRLQARRSMVVAAAGDIDLDDVEDARGAIALGIKLYNDGNYDDASALFTKVVKDQVSGTGIKRYRDKPPTPSAGEKMAALYNIACCGSKTDDIETGLAAFAGALENGFDDLATARSDPDLAKLREDERFEGLIARFFPAADKQGGIMSWLSFQMDPKNSAVLRAMNKDNK